MSSLGLRSVLKLLILFFFSLILFLIEACGIKRPPKPPPYPEFQVRRIGGYVYLLTQDRDVVPEGFEKLGNFWVVKRQERFCFEVSHRRGRSVMRCVEEAPKGKPKVKIEVYEERVLLRLKGYKLYRVYRFEGYLVPVPVAESKGTVTLRRGEKRKVFAVTGVMGNRETEPVLIEVPPLQLPKPKPPEDLSYTVRGKRIVLFWRGEEGLKYLVYRNGELLTSEPIISNVFIDKLPPPGTVYRVVSVDERGERSEPAEIVYRP